LSQLKEPGLSDGSDMIRRSELNAWVLDRS